MNLTRRGEPARGRPPGDRRAPWLCPDPALPHPTSTAPNCSFGPGVKRHPWTTPCPAGRGQQRCRRERRPVHPHRPTTRRRRTKRPPGARAGHSRDGRPGEVDSRAARLVVRRRQCALQHLARRPRGGHPCRQAGSGAPQVGVVTAARLSACWMRPERTLGPCAVRRALTDASSPCR